MKYDLLKLENKLKKKVDEKRYNHTKGVEMTAACLAMKLGYDNGLAGDDSSEFIEKARVAGLLHDYAKNMNDDELLEICKKNKISVSEIEIESPYLLHGKVAAHYCKNKFDITDMDILNAISYHTTGRPNMSLLEKIIFVADYIEPGRNKQDNLDIIRHLAFTNIDRCIYVITDDTINYLIKKGKSVKNTDLTKLTRDYYLEYIKKEVDND